MSGTQRGNDRTTTKASARSSTFQGYSRFLNIFAVSFQLQLQRSGASKESCKQLHSVSSPCSRHPVWFVNIYICVYIIYICVCVSYFCCCSCFCLVGLQRIPGGKSAQKSIEEESTRLALSTRLRQLDFGLCSNKLP